MKQPRIKVKVFAVLLNDVRDAHLVWRGTDDTKTPPDFHRLLGGHLEFGEAALEGVRREIFEETGVELIDPTPIGVLENRFVYQDNPGHEIVFVYAGIVGSPAGVTADGGWLADNGHPIWVEWRPVRPVTEALPPLYPAGLQTLIEEMLRPLDRRLRC